MCSSNHEVHVYYMPEVISLGQYSICNSQSGMSYNLVHKGRIKAKTLFLILISFCLLIGVGKLGPAFKGDTRGQFCFMRYVEYTFLLMYQ